MPDYLGVSAIENPRSVLFSLLSIGVALSSLSITFIILVHNFFFKALRRNAIQIVFKSGWVRLLVTSTTAITLYILGTWALLSEPITGADITGIYLSGFWIVSALFLNLPLLTVVMQDSLSLKVIRRLASEVTESSFHRFDNPSDGNEEAYRTVENLEDNPIIQLRDIAIDALRNKDWSIPQTVLNHSYEAIIAPIDEKTESSEIRMRLGAWCHVCERVAEASIKNDSTRQVEIVSNVLLLSTNWLCKKRRFSHHNRIATTLTEIQCALLRRPGYDAEKSKAVDTVIEYLKIHGRNLRLSDAELPTWTYIDAEKLTYKEATKHREKNLSYWHFLTDTMGGHLRSVLDAAYEATPELQRKDIEWPIGFYLGSLLEEKGLSKYQQDDLMVELYADVSHIIVQKRKDDPMYDGLFMDHVLVGMIINERKLSYWALRDFIDYVSATRDDKTFFSSRPHKLFIIGRQVAESKQSNETITRCLEMIVKACVYLADLEANSGIAMKNPYATTLRSQLKMLYTLVKEKPQYSELLKSEERNILKLVHDV